MLGVARPLHAIVALVVALAAASLLLPFAPAYDPWAWLVWGREVWGLDLDTSAGPSWKPLPVLIDVPLGWSGDAAPDLWLFVARIGWLATLPLAWRVASRLAGGGRCGIAAGAVAAAGMLAFEDAYTPWLRQFAGGLSEPLLVALCLLAIDRALSERHGQALLAGAAAALIRPEAWPLLAIYALWACRRDPALRGRAIAWAAAVACLWFVPDLVGAGNPLEGAERARGLEGGALGDATEALKRVFELVPLAWWPLAMLGLAAPAATSRPVVRALAAGALAWVAMVAVLAVAGYAGLPRFMAPAGAVVCVLAGVGAAVAWRWLVPRPAALRLAAAAAITVAVVASLVPRAADLPADYRKARELGELNEDLFAAAGEAPPPSPGCGPVATDEPLSVSALAWRLDLPLSGAVSTSRPDADAALAFAFAGGVWTDTMQGILGPVTAEQGRWRVYTPCSTPGVSGAVR